MTFQAHINHGESLEATAIRADIKAGDQILNYYGPLPTSELLRRYGYVTPEHSRYDVVEVPWTLVKEVIVSSLSLSAEAWKQVVSLTGPPSRHKTQLNRAYRRARLTTRKSKTILS